MDPKSEAALADHAATIDSFVALYHPSMGDDLRQLPLVFWREGRASILEEQLDKLTAEKN